MSSKYCVVAYFGVNSFQASGEASWKGLLRESSTQWLPDLGKQDEEHGMNINEDQNPQN